MSKFLWAALVQCKDTLDDVRAERGEATELKPLMKLRQKLTNPRKSCSFLFLFFFPHVSRTSQEVTTETLAGPF